MNPRALAVLGMSCLMGTGLAQTYNPPPAVPVPAMPQPLPPPSPGFPAPLGQPYPGVTPMRPGSPYPYPSAVPGIRPIQVPGAPAGLRPPEVRQATEWPLPAPSAGARLALSPDGNLFVSLSDLNRIVRFDPRTQRTSEWPSGLPGPKGIAVDRQGRIWFAATGGIGQLNPATGQVREFHPSSGGDAAQVAIDPQGGVWFTLSATGMLGRLDPATGRIEQFELGGQPLALATDRTGNAWVALQNRDGVLKFDGRSNQPAEISLGPGSQPVGLAIGQDGLRLWVLLGGVQSAVIGLDTGSGQFDRHYRLPGLPQGQSPALAFDSRGELWLVGSGGSPFIRLNVVSGTTVPVTAPNASSLIEDLTIDGAGNVWYVSGSAGRLGTLQ